MQNLRNHVIRSSYNLTIPKSTKPQSVVIQEHTIAHLCIATKSKEEEKEDHRMNGVQR